jgi:hypothetical protein
MNMISSSTYRLIALIFLSYRWIHDEDLFIANAFSMVEQSLLSRSRRCSSRTSSSTTKLHPVIRPESVDFDFDIGQGGVRLAEESVIKITGTVTHRPGHAEPNISNLIRYKQIQTIRSDNEQMIMNTLQQMKATIIATGRGVELYKDPGTTTEQVIVYAPMDAVRDALMSAQSALQYNQICINFCSGSDGQVLEILSAITKLVLDLDIATKTKITFNSISHTTFPMGTTSVTVVGMNNKENDDSENDNNSEENSYNSSIVNGEIYFRDGIYYMLSDQDIHTAIA